MLTYIVHPDCTFLTSFSDPITLTRYVTCGEKLIKPVERIGLKIQSDDRVSMFRYEIPNAENVREGT